MPKRLILFDIDGTLIASNFSGRRVVAYALQAVFGTTGALDDYSFAGRTDLGIISDLLTGAGFAEEQITTGLPRVYKLMAEKGGQIFFQEDLAPCPGVERLLNALRADSRFILGLQTGNIRPTALQKLRAAGMDPKWFPVGAFGSDSADREGLLPAAWRRAQRLTGRAFSGHNTVAVGDTPGDILSAQANEAQTVAVASGTYTFQALAEHRPDHLLSDLSDTARIMRILTGTETG